MAVMTVVMVALGADEYFTDHRLRYVVFDAALVVGFALLAVAVLSRNPRIQRFITWPGTRSAKT
jgi:hypothetical protein